MTKYYFGLKREGNPAIRDDRDDPGDSMPSEISQPQKDEY